MAVAGHERICKICRVNDRAYAKWMLKIGALARKVGMKTCSHEVMCKFFKTVVNGVCSLQDAFVGIIRGAFNFQPYSVAVFDLMFEFLAVAPSESIVEAARIKYLEWISNEQGVKAAFEHYLKFCETGAHGTDLHEAMRSICLNRQRVNETYVLITLQKQCVLSGADDADTWTATLEYVELIEPNKKFVKMIVEALVADAKVTLLPVSLDEFLDVVKTKGYKIN